MVTIAMVIQYGIDSGDLPVSLARELGCDVIDNREQELSLVASERRKSRRFDYWLAKCGVRRRSFSSMVRLTSAASETWREAVGSENVLVVGWSSVLSLPTNAADIRVLLHAPREIRVERFAKQRNVRCVHDLERAFDRIEQQISAYLEALHGRDWTASHHFDLAINSGRCTPRSCSTLIQSWLGSASNTISCAYSQQTDCEPTTLPAFVSRCEGRTFAVLDQDRVDLSAVESHEAAIAAIEERLHKECYRRCH